MSKPANQQGTQSEILHEEKCVRGGTEMIRLVRVEIFMQCVGDL